VREKGGIDRWAQCYYMNDRIAEANGLSMGYDVIGDGGRVVYSLYIHHLGIIYSHKSSGGIAHLHPNTAEHPLPLLQVEACA